MKTITISKELANFIQSVPKVDLIKAICRLEHIDSKLTVFNENSAAIKRYSIFALREEFKTLELEIIKEKLIDVVLNDSIKVIVEDEPKYIVVLPNPNNTSKNIICLRKVHTGEPKNTIQICRVNKDKAYNSEYCKLTEGEIKQDFEWAWNSGFAEKVE